MTQITVDQQTAGKLRAAHDAVDLCDEQGNSLGLFFPEFGKPPAGFDCPFTEEELRERFAETGSLTTEEVLARLKDEP